MIKRGTDPVSSAIEWWRGAGAYWAEYYVDWCFIAVSLVALGLIQVASSFLNLFCCVKVKVEVVRAQIISIGQSHAFADNHRVLRMLCLRGIYI